MNCQICKTPYTVTKHFQCMETMVDYPENTVVTDLLNRKPEVFAFLVRVLKSQVTRPDRFTPIPTWFAKSTSKDVAASKVGIVDQSKLLDFEMFKQTVECIHPAVLLAKAFNTDLDMLAYTGQDQYMLLRFMVLSCPLKLEHVNIQGWEQFKVTWDETTEQKFEIPGKKPEYLYHGSPLSNWQCIMREGLKVTSGTAWMSTGAAFGNGIYASDTLHVSYGYSCGQSAIVIGVYEIYEPQRFNKAPGYFVIPDKDLMLLRYLIYIACPSKIDIVAVDKELKNMWDKKSTNKATAIVSKQKKVEARIAREIQMLEDNGAKVTRTNASEIRVTLGKFTYDVIFPFLFPFSAPIIKDMGLIGDMWTLKSTVLDFIR